MNLYQNEPFDHFTTFSVFFFSCFSRAELDLIQAAGLAAKSTLPPRGGGGPAQPKEELPENKELVGWMETQGEGLLPCEESLGGEEGHPWLIVAAKVAMQPSFTHTRPPSTPYVTPRAVGNKTSSFGITPETQSSGWTSGRATTQNNV